MEKEENIFERARAFLADTHSKKQEEGQKSIFKDSQKAAETLCWTIDLLQSLKASPLLWLDPSSADWKVVKPLLELLVRLGIAPYLSPGVGLPREKNLEGASSALATASALAIHLSGLSLASPSLQSLSSRPDSGTFVLFLCAEVLTSFVWKPFSFDELGDCHNRDIMEICGPPVAPIAQLVMRFYLWDLMAAYLQLGFGPIKSDGGLLSCTHLAKARLKQMVENLPVERMIEASFLLLNRDSPAPPPWLKAEVGKQLSKLVMRIGGLAAVLGKLVGRVTQGDVRPYNRIADHLAKVPNSVATADAYYRALCPQLLPLLLLKTKSGTLVLGDSSLMTINNIYHTSVSLVCKLSSLEPSLARQYLGLPLMRPLLALKSIQKGAESIPVSAANEDLVRSDEQVTEEELIDTLVQVAILLTAGSSGAESARDAVLLEVRTVAPLLLKLHFQLVGKADVDDGDSEKKAKGAQKGLSKGLLQKGLGVDGLREQSYELQTPLSRIISALGDIVMAQLSQPAVVALPSTFAFLLENDTCTIEWPCRRGEVFETLQPTGHMSRSPAMYLSRLLLTLENWSLVLALMGELLNKILDFRRSLMESNASKIPEAAAELLRHMQGFEELNNEVGTKALEHDVHGAASLVKALLEDELVLSDDDVLELVLHMVKSVVQGFRYRGENDVEACDDHSCVDELIVCDLSASLERVYSNASVSEQLRHMAFTLSEEIIALCRAF